MPKKDQERDGYAWMYGTQARKGDKHRTVPEYWQEHADAWLQGFDGVPTGTAGPKVVSDQMEAEFDEAAIKSSPDTV